MEREDPVTVELDRDTFDVVHELVLRGLRQTDVTEREYGEAYDEFVDASGGPIRIGDQPDRVKDVWEEVSESEPGEVLILDEAGYMTDEQRTVFKKFFSTERRR